MNTIDLDTTAKVIIDGNIYLTLATTNGMTPWISPVFYCADKQYNLYFISQPTSLHSRYLKKNKQAAFAIFDSHQPEGTGNGVQGSCFVEKVKGKAVDNALKFYKTSFIPLNRQSLSGKNPYRLYKLVPNKVFVLDPSSKVDKRVKVQLN